METKRICLRETAETTWEEALREASEWLRQDYPVAFPTETVYGLGANAFSSAAVRRIFAAKGRPADNPLIVHIAAEEQLARLVEEVTPAAQLLMRHFWPGPITLVLPAKVGIAAEVTAGLETVGVRMPDHPLALALIESSGLPLAAPSANRSGRPSPTSAAHVMQDLEGMIPLVLDCGPSSIGVESTVVNCAVCPPVLLRPGGVSLEAIREVVGDVLEAPAAVEGQAPPSPGMKYTHYAPQGELWLVSGSEKRVQELIRRKVEEALAQKRRVGVLATEESCQNYPQGTVLTCGNRGDLATVARSLFDVLRQFDEAGVDVIYAEVFPQAGLGRALMNRMVKASGSRWLRT